MWLRLCSRCDLSPIVSLCLWGRPHPLVPLSIPVSLTLLPLGVEQAAGSITYDPQQLPVSLQKSIDHNLRRLLRQAEEDSHKPQSFKLAKGGALPIPGNAHARNVKFGFKAPVAMTLLPWWKELCTHLMFLHVTRDGRDIAFSANQVRGHDGHTH